MNSSRRIISTKNYDTIKQDLLDDIAYLENELTGQYKLLTFLDQNFASLGAPPKKTITDYRTEYTVRSRSGRLDHIIGYKDFQYSCSCAAAINGRVCWAVKGIAAVHGQGGSFYADGVKHTYTIRYRVPYQVEA